MSHTPNAPQLRTRTQGRSFSASSMRNASLMTRNLEPAAVACESTDAPETTSSEGDSHTSSIRSSIPSSDNESVNTSESVFQCNICLDTARDSVVTLCGHLFCWPCLQQWLVARPIQKSCPVCRARINEYDVVPMFFRNRANQEDPRVNLPVPPQAPQDEPHQQREIRYDFHMAFGVILFGLDFGIIPAFDGRRNLDRNVSHFLMTLTLMYFILVWCVDQYF